MMKMQTKKGVDVDTSTNDTTRKASKAIAQTQTAITFLWVDATVANDQNALEKLNAIRTYLNFAQTKLNELNTGN